MFVRCHLPSVLDTGPGTKKSSTLCSLVLMLLVIATFLVCEVPGQMEEEIVGLGNHKRTGNQVELNPYTVNVTEKIFNLTEYKCRFRDACDVKIEKGYIEIQYNEDGKGCIVDLLSKNKDKIKLTAGVMNKRGGIKNCLVVGGHVENSYNNSMSFVYSVNNKVIEILNKGPNKDSGTCKKNCAACMPWTVSWSRSTTSKYVYAHTYLVAEEKRGLSPKDELEDSEMTFDLEITAADKFTMNFAGKHEFDPKGICGPESSQSVNPKTWTIMNPEFQRQHLLVFSLLSRNATRIFNEEGITFGKPSVPYCELFVRFKRPDYELLYVKPQPPPTPTTSTTKVTSTETTETSTCAPCPTSTALMTTTTAAKNISSPAVKCPAEGKCPEKSCGWPNALYVILIVVGVIIIGILAWFTWNWVEVNSEKRAARAAKREKDRAWYSDYQAEAKVKGSENMKPFAIWKDDKIQEYNKRFMDRHPIDKLSAAMWRKAEKEKDDKSKMQFIVDQIVRFKDQELYDNEYQPELTEKGYETVGEFEEWKKKKYINTFAVVETEIEYEKPDNVGKELLPGASIEDKKKARR